MDDYEKFLAEKAKTVGATGVAGEVEISGSLFDFQAAIVKWALRKGKAAIFANTGLGKTIMQAEWARNVALHTDKPVLILAPLAVAKQTAEEAMHRIGLRIKHVRHALHVDDGPFVHITNYDMMHEFVDAAKWGGVVLDESSILKSLDGKRRTQIIDGFVGVPFKLACTATPAPNDFTELGNHAQFGETE